MATTQTGTFLGPTDLLTQFRTFVIANGWTENMWADEGLGKRLHIQKTVDGETFYFNYRAMEGESLPNSPWTFGWTAIFAQGSTGFDAGLGSLFQPGNPPEDSGVPQGGNVMYFGGTLRDYRFVSSDTHCSLSIVDDNDSWQHMVCCSAPSSFGVYCNGSFKRISSPEETNYQRNYLFVQSVNRTHPGCSTYDNGTWRFLYEYSSGGNSPRPMFTAERGLITPSILNDSVNRNIGIPVLFPFTVAVGTVSSLKMFDGIDGVKILNKKYIDDGQVITVGGEDYAVYAANSNKPNFGIAFQIT